MSFDLHTNLVLVLATALVAFAFSFTRRFFIRRQFARLHGCQPVARSANIEPFLGLDLLPSTIRLRCQHKLLEKNCENFRVLGNTFKVTELRRRAIVTVEPENIKTVLSVNFKDYGIGHRLTTFKPLLGAGIFDTDGDHWTASRALIRPNFTRDQVADLTSFENLFQDLVSLLPRNRETVVDLQDLFFRYTIDSATEFLFGQSVGTMKKMQPELGFAEAFDYAQLAVIIRGALGPLGIFYHDQKADKCNRICREFARQFVEDAFRAVESDRQDKEKDLPEATRQKYVFSHELARRTSDKDRILDELMNVLLAGRDTTASLLSNLFFMLAKNPAIWEKLRREVAGLEGRAPTYEELRCLRYVQCCLNECENSSLQSSLSDILSLLTSPALRLHPVVPRNERMAVRDTVLPVGGGKDGLSPVFVPKGTLVAYNIYAMHRRTDFYGPDAEEFRPERWEDGRLQPRWEYLPFNGGPRICVGQRYALTEVGYVLVRMAQEYKTLESQDPGPWEESLTLTLCSRNGTKVSLTPA